MTPSGIDLVAADPEALHRQRIQNFVRQHDAAEFLGQAVEPFDACRVRRRPLAHERLLPFPQVRTHFENEIALGQGALRRQLVEQIGRHHARAGAEFEDRAAADVLQDFAALGREAAAEQRRHLRRGDEVAAGAELARAGAVIAEPGLVQRHLHEALEADPTRLRIDGVVNAIDDPLAMSGLRGRQLGQGTGVLHRVRHDRRFCRL